MRRISRSSPGPSRSPAARSPSAFTLVEILLVIAIIGIMASLVITVIGGAARDSHAVVARQQQVVVQEALNAWIANASGSGGVVAARTAYNAAGSDAAKLALLEPYLGGDTYSHLTDAAYSSGGSIGSASLQAVGNTLGFTTWTTTNYPAVELR